MAVRHKEFASLCRKVMAMKAKVHERPQPKAVEREESSVGTVASPAAAATSQNLATAV